MLHVAVPVVLLSCIERSVKDTNSMSRLEQASLMRTPLILKGALHMHGAIPHNIAEFEDKFGEYNIQARRTQTFARMDNTTFGNYDERRKDVSLYNTSHPHVSVRRFLREAIASDHVILFDREPGMSDSEKELLDALRDITRGPRILDRAKEAQFFSLGAEYKELT